jgi:hypothetical protein
MNYDAKSSLRGKLNASKVLLDSITSSLLWQVADRTGMEPLEKAQLKVAISGAVGNLTAALALVPLHPSQSDKQGFVPRRKQKEDIGDKGITTDDAA